MKHWWHYASGHRSVEWIVPFDRMNTTYKAQFNDRKPARTAVVVSKLVGKGHVEITTRAKK